MTRYKTCIKLLIYIELMSISVQYCLNKILGYSFPLGSLNTIRTNAFNQGFQRACRNDGGKECVVFKPVFIIKNILCIAFNKGACSHIRTYFSSKPLFLIKLALNSDTPSVSLLIEGD